MRTVLRQPQDDTERCIRIALVNNMPDAALERTETQFRSLLGCAAPDIRIELALFALSDVPRGAAGRLHLETQNYRPTEEIPAGPVDAVIVTGTEPREAALEDEPYWDGMTALFDWLEDARLPAIFSCLASHAAVQHFDGIRRVRLWEKRFGIFNHATINHNRITEHLTPVVPIAHSRWNELPAAVLADRGYRILTQSCEAGAGLFQGRDHDLWLFCQGHPEYDEGALGREYVRDVKRYLAGRRDVYPDLPQNYFDDHQIAALTVFRAHAQIHRRSAVIDEFPLARLGDGEAPRAMAPTGPIFRSWLQQIAEHKSRAVFRRKRTSGKATPLARAANRYPLPAA